MRDINNDTVVHDTGWISDGHSIHWSNDGIWITHPNSRCPYYVNNGMRYYLCSPGVQEDTFGIFLNDLPLEQFERASHLAEGNERFQYRVKEAFHPDMDDTQVQAVTIFEIQLDEEEHVND